MTLDAWLLFAAIWFAAGIPLGPNAANCIAVSASHGFGRALWAVAGILAAGLFYMGAVVLGLGAVLAANEVLFAALKLLGAAYLIWMGIKMIRSKPGRSGMTPVPVGRRQVLVKAMLVSFSNPKAMLSYGAVFSQFVNPEAGFAAQLLIIVPTALAINAGIYSGYALLGRGVDRLIGTATRLAWFNRGIGGFYVVAGAALAADEISDVRRRMLA
ncbi:MAG: LysE family translocator [Paracoccaceae bacterium]|nr:LysE family translocator [Paracoccaceae bacterium]